MRFSLHLYLPGSQNDVCACTRGRSVFKHLPRFPANITAMKQTYEIAILAFWYDSID